MNYRVVLRVLSRVSYAEAFFLAISAGVALLHGEEVIWTYLIPIGILVLIGTAFGLPKPRTQDLFAREGFASVALAWVYLSAIGALPFFLSGAVPSYIDSLFETVSGFTTTGATILPDIESMPKGLLFWRSFTHWIGGMGVLVFLMAIIPLAGSRSMYLMRAESPGPTVGKLVPRAKSSALILYGIYFALTALEIVILLLCGMPPYDSVTTAFSTAGTGGFGVTNTSIMAYGSPAIENVLTAFQLLFGVNFTLYFLALMGRPLTALRSEELRWYLGIFAVATAVITASILPETEGLGMALRLAAFQSASVMSSTGFASADFNGWPELAQATLLLLMIIGACAGSTGGGFKVSRMAILVKSVRREISRMIHPRQVAHIKFEGKTVEAETTHGVLVYLAVYVMLLIVGVLLIALNGFDFTTTFTSVLTTVNNVGPGLARIGPMDNFALFSPLSKAVLSGLMLFGRLEIFPMLLLLSPSVWRRQ